MQFVRFGLVGISNTLIMYFIYLLLLKLRLNYLIAYAIGFFISLINAFYWNNRYVFKQEKGEQRSKFRAFFKMLLSYTGTGLILASLLLILWVEILHIPELIGPVLSLLITIPFNFVLNKLWAFRERK